MRLVSRPPLFIQLSRLLAIPLSASFAYFRTRPHNTARCASQLQSNIYSAGHTTGAVKKALSIMGVENGSSGRRW